MAVIWVSLRIQKEEAGLPLKLTPVALRKPVPVIVMIVPPPVLSLVGLRDVTVGAVAAV
jgi:hypothetical protein